MSASAKLNSSTSNLVENGPVGRDHREPTTDKLLPSPSLERGFSKENGELLLLLSFSFLWNAAKIEVFIAYLDCNASNIVVTMVKW